MHVCCSYTSTLKLLLQAIERAQGKNQTATEEVDTRSLGSGSTVSEELGETALLSQEEPEEGRQLKLILDEDR